MSRVNDLKKHLKGGQVHRRADLARWSNAVDRHISELLKEGVLERLSPGVYHVPKKTAFGAAPPTEELLVRRFLKDDDFLLTSPNVYNSLGVGTTQLYNKRVVYNHKRHGEYKLGGRTFFFHTKHRFPKRLTQEFLLVDLVNNLKHLAEDREQVLANVLAKAKAMDAGKMRRAVMSYGGAKAKSLLLPLIHTAEKRPHAA